MSEHRQEVPDGRLRKCEGGGKGGEVKVDQGQIVQGVTGQGKEYKVPCESDGSHRGLQAGGGSGKVPFLRPALAAWLGNIGSLDNALSGYELFIPSLSSVFWKMTRKNR